MGVMIWKTTVKPASIFASTTSSPAGGMTPSTAATVSAHGSKPESRARRPVSIIRKDNKKKRRLSASLFIRAPAKTQRSGFGGKTKKNPVRCKRGRKSGLFSSQGFF